MAELDAQRATLKARLGKQERANDTRRKVLLGALILHRLESGKDEEFSRRLREWLKRELPDFPTRPGDKELFADLPATRRPGRRQAAPGGLPHESGAICMGRVQEHDAAGRA